MVVDEEALLPLWGWLKVEKGVRSFTSGVQLFVSFLYLTCFPIQER